MYSGNQESGGGCQATWYTATISKQDLQVVQTESKYGVKKYDSKVKLMGPGLGGAQRGKFFNAGRFQVT